MILSFEITSTYCMLMLLAIVYIFCMFAVLYLVYCFIHKFTEMTASDYLSLAYKHGTRNK